MSRKTTSLDEYLARRETALAGVRQTLLRQIRLDRTPEELDPDAVLFGAGLGLDSLDAVELIVALEHEHHVRIDDSPASRAALRTLNTLVDLILRAKEASHGA